MGSVSQQQLEDLIEGIEIEGVRYGQINANLERRTGANTWIEMTLTEGKNREVRRVLEHLGLSVNRLIRTAYGPFTLGGSAVGSVAEVDENTLSKFRATLAAAPKPRAPAGDASIRQHQRDNWRVKAKPAARPVARPKPRP